MTDEHKHLEAIATNLDEVADTIFGDVAADRETGRISKKVADEETAKGQAYRRAAEIIRYQMECEA